MILSIMMACITSEPKEDATPMVDELTPTQEEAVEVDTVESPAPTNRKAPEMKKMTPKRQSAEPSAPTEQAPDATEEVAPQLIGDSNVFHSPEDDATGEDAAPQVIGDSNVNSGADEDIAEDAGSSGFPGQVQTNALLSNGILRPIPETLEIGTPLNVVFNTLYPNGCWRQSEPTHSVDDVQITHSYTTNQLENQICTMAMVPGGFSTQINLENTGKYTGRILVDGSERAQYTVTVSSSE